MSLLTMNNRSVRKDAAALASATTSVTGEHQELRLTTAIATTFRANKLKNVVICCGLAILVAVQMYYDGNGLRLPRTTFPSLRQRSIVMKRTKIVDSCGLVSSTKQVHFRPFNEQDISWFRNFQACFIDLNREDLSMNTTINTLRDLDCTIAINQSIVQWTIEQYRTIYFIGDSILRHQFFAFICLAQPNATRAQVRQGPGGNGFYAHLEFDFRFHNGTKKTSLIYDRFGQKFEDGERPIYETVFPRLVDSASSHDAFVLTAGAHYMGHLADKMKRVLMFIAMKSLETKAPVFLIEATNEEWPTTNGLFVVGCPGECLCHAVDEATLWGHSTHFGTVIPPGIFPINGIMNQSAEATFRMIYPTQWPSLINTSFYRGCGENCGPNRWRVDLQRSLLAPETMDYVPNVTKRLDHKVLIAPIYWQLVAMGIATNGKAKDCTHKNTYGQWILVRQLIRTMLGDLHRKGVVTGDVVTI